MKCEYCGTKMKFDGCWWYTCPNCGHRIRSHEDGSWSTFDSEEKEKKEHFSDFELADFCRGGDLSED